MLYESAHEWLGWPPPDQVFEPKGAGARMYADFAKKKIGGALKLQFPDVDVQVGILSADANSQNTETPLAVICQFPHGAREEVLDWAHRLAWNFSRTALLITLEPHQLTAWSCYQNPTLSERRIGTLPTPDGFKPSGSQEQRDIRNLLHWVSLITNRAQQILPEQFRAYGRADALLLANLRFVRTKLSEDLAKEFCHDLLARVIFTQFLFHRKDSGGTAFFSQSLMKRLHDDGILSNTYTDLGSILTHKADTYALFKWMDGRFNGDLFPGKEGDSEELREAAWRAEREAVQPEHLKLLADLIRGDLDAKGQQLTLWPYYSFDTIPLEFISSVYEEFLTADERETGKAYYTPSYLVDYVLDAVLPWSGEDWNLRVLDPCCGSGIFLVKAFQRLIHRWRKAHKREPLVSDLRPILANNLVGVDKNKEAVRVACFSLYLAMADAIDPKHYVTNERVKVFPALRGKRLLPVDFFSENVEGIRTIGDKESYDLVVGNAPWGDKTIAPEKIEEESKTEYKKRARLNPTPAEIWSKDHKWPVANFDIGPVFLGKSASLVKNTGLVGLVETASLLYWRDGKATELRRRLFSSYRFEEITNLAALRRDIFSEAIGSACVVVFANCLPTPETTFLYFAPKPLRAKRGVTAQKGFNVDPQDVAQLTHAAAAESPWVWSVLAMGSKRHFSLISKLSTFTSLAKLEAAHVVKTRKGVVVGNRKQHFPQYEKCPILKSPRFPKDVFLELDASTLPEWKDASATEGDSVDFSPFKSPQALIKQSYVAELGRMRAVAIKQSTASEVTVCREAYITVHDLTADARYIRSACLAYNSQFAVFFFALTSGSFPLYISKVSVGELLNLPLPSYAPDITTFQSFCDIDAEMHNHYSLTPADWILIDDFLRYTLPDVLKKTPGLARKHTTRKNETELSDYAKTFGKVIKSTFGKDKGISATIYAEPDATRLPVRMLTLKLDSTSRDLVSIQPIETDGLLDLLSKLHCEQLANSSRLTSARMGFQRVAYFFHPSREDGVRVMNLTIIKPDECRYWTRSMAMRDADQLAGAIAKASASKKGNQ